MGKKNANIDMSSPEFKKMVDELLEEIKGIPEDPETLKAAEELHRKLSYLSPEDLLKTVYNLTKGVSNESIC